MKLINLPAELLPGRLDIVPMHLLNMKASIGTNKLRYHLFTAKALIGSSKTTVEPIKKHSTNLTIVSF